MASIPQTMKALVKEKPGVSYVYKDVPVPQPGEGELLVKVSKNAVCGSDIVLYQWGEGMEIHVLCLWIKKIIYLENHIVVCTG